MPPYRRRRRTNRPSDPRIRQNESLQVHPRAEILPVSVFRYMHRAVIDTRGSFLINQGLDEEPITKDELYKSKFMGQSPPRRAA